MSIKFFCQCGKRLRARDEMAGRRSMCPRCGNPVGIPSLRPSHPDGRLGPMTLPERLKAQRQVKPSSQDKLPGEPFANTPDPALDSLQAGIVAPYVRASLLRQAFSRKDRFRHRRGLETHWYECLLFPLRALPLIFVLAAAFAVMTGVAFALAERGGLEVELTWDWAARLLWLAIPVLVVGYACGFLDCTLASAAAGELPTVRWPGRNVSMALKSLITWLACFLAGPILPAGILFLYWSQCGEIELIDWLILAELSILAFGYWFLVVLAVGLSDRLRDANPIQIIVLVRRVGWRLLALAVAAPVLFLGHGLLALNAIELLHKQASGLLLLAGYWFSALFLATFLFRLVGLWCYQSRAGTGA